METMRSWLRSLPSPRALLRHLAKGRRLAWLSAALVGFGLAPVGGCGPTIYTVNVMPAARAVHRAEEAGAPTHAPYEYWYARAHLDQAREEAGEAMYQDAIRNAKIAEEYGVKALELARRRMREQGR